jgi:hypothetical protein
MIHLVPFWVLLFCPWAGSLWNIRFNGPGEFNYLGINPYSLCMKMGLVHAFHHLSTSKYLWCFGKNHNQNENFTLYIYIFFLIYHTYLM